MTPDEDDALEVTPLAPRAADRVRLTRSRRKSDRGSGRGSGRGWGRGSDGELGGRAGWRCAALTMAIILLAVATPLVALTPTRAAIERLFGPPTPTPVTHISVTIVISSTVETDIPATDWSALSARPLSLPALAPGTGCPAQAGRVAHPGFGPALGDGPVYVVGAGREGTLLAASPARFGEGRTDWGGQRVFLLLAPGYTGPVLVRGKRLDTPGPLLFNGGLDQLNVYAQATTTLLRQVRVEGNASAPWAAWGIYLRMRQPGCYGLQIDGESFSETVTLRVTFTG